MSLESRHQASQVETVKLELDRAHRAALKLEAGEIRRGLQLAIATLKDAAAPIASVPETSVPPASTMAQLTADLEHALQVLQEGKLAELGNLIEAARKVLEA